VEAVEEAVAMDSTQRMATRLKKLEESVAMVEAEEFMFTLLQIKSAAGQVVVYIK
jgi:hypothetical protein